MMTTLKMITRVVKRTLLVLGVGLLPTIASAQATTTISPGANVIAAIEAAAEGDTIQLNPGIYTLQYTTFYTDPAQTLGFGIGRRIKLIGLGATPADVTLRAFSTSSYSVQFLSYLTPGPGGGPGVTYNASGSTIQNLTIDTGGGGIAITHASLRYADITLKDLIIKTKVDGPTFGVLVQNTDRVVIDNVTVTSNQSGFYVINTNDLLMMNSTVTGTGTNAGGTNVGAATLAVFGGSGNRFVGNTFGSPKADPKLDSGYSVNTGNVVFYSTKANRFERNTVQGHRDDGLDFGVVLGVPAGVALDKPTDNYAGKNTIVSTGYAAGRKAGSGMWTNCGSDNSWLYANDSTGSAECGLCVWLSNSNMALGNRFHGNRLNGIFVSGGAETAPFCPVPAFNVKPSFNFVRNSEVVFNQNDQIVTRNADNTDISLNFTSPRETFGGPAQICNPANTACQSAFSLETEASAPSLSTGLRLAGNLSLGNNRGIQSDDGRTTGLEFVNNRIIGSTSNRFVGSSALNLDGGSSVGGNFWTQHSAIGNPSSTTPFKGVFDNISNTAVLNTDRFPFQTEDLGRGYNLTIFEPLAGLSAAQGTLRTARWYAPGCSYVDISLDGTTLLAAAPNTGYEVVTIPAAASIGSHFLRLSCKNSAGAIRGTADSGAFNVTASALQLVSPGRDDVLDAGTPFFVAWKRTAAITSVLVEFCSNVTTGCSTLATVTGTGTFARVTIPANTPSTAYGVIRISSGANVDTTDGVFALRGDSGAGFTNIAAGRKFVMGQMERLEWASPKNSRVATITATVGVTTKTIANNLPDRGNFDWFVDDLGAGAVTMSISFKQTNGTAIGAASTNTSGASLYPTLITFGATPAIAPGASTTISATANSGTAVTFTSLSTSVCTVSGTTVQAVAAGLCVVAANAPADATHAASPQVTLSFNVGTAQTITFNPPTLVTIDGIANLVATASSALTVSFRSITGTVCGVAGTVASGLAAGTCTVEATQDGNSSFSAAATVTKSFPVVVNTTIPRLVNIATRARVQTGDNVMIAGFIIGGDRAKKVLITARGPSLAPFVPGSLDDPFMQIFSGATQIESNDDYQSRPNWPDIPASIRPPSLKEAAILISLSPGAYTAIVTGVGAASGVAIVEVFEIDLPEIPLINIATRSRVETGDNVMIAGFIIQGNAARTVLVTARGPSLAAAPFNVPGTLADPYLKIYSGQTLIFENDNWETGPGANLIPETQKPKDPKDSALRLTLAPGAYTAIVSGGFAATSSGVAIAEVFVQ